MNAKEFRENILSYYNNYYRALLSKRKLIGVRNTGLPSTVVTAESPTQYVSELIGCRRLCSPEDFKLTATPIQRVSSVNNFINPNVTNGDGQPSRIIGGGGQGSIFLVCIAFSDTNATYEAFRSIFPFPLRTTNIRSGNCHGTALHIDDEVNNVYFYQVDLLCRASELIAYRTINIASVFKKDVTCDSLKKSLTEFTNGIEKLTGTPSIVPFQPTAAEFARQLAGLLSVPITETAIDKFIQTNSRYFTRALGYQSCIPQCELHRQSRRLPGQVSFLQPDYLMKREDGYYDIVDLKRALLKTPIIVGPVDRKRFGEYVNNLFAQLATYEDYFNNLQNAEWAEMNYGVRLSSARLIGIVGNYQSFEREEVNCALSMFDPKIALFSYNELVNLLIQAE